MLIEYCHSANHGNWLIYNTEKAFKNLPKFFNSCENLTDFTKQELKRFNEDMCRGIVLGIRHNSLRGEEIIVKNPSSTCDGVEVLKLQGYEDLTPELSCWTHRFFYKDGKFYLPIGWNRKDPVFNGSIVIKEIPD